MADGDNIEQHIRMQCHPLKGEILNGWQKSMPKGEKFYPLDIFVSGIAHRSLRLIDGFCELVKDRNFLAAAPMVRIQLDSSLRLFAATLVVNPHEFASKVMSGERIDRMKDKNGKQMHDRYLVEQLNHSFKWVNSVYDKTSGFVHFSEAHIFQVISLSEQDWTIEIRVGGDRDDHIPDKAYIEAVDAFAAATKVVIFLLDSWISAKFPRFKR